MISLLLAAALATPTPPVNIPNKYQEAVNACAQGYTDFRYGRVQDSLQKVLNKFQPEERPLVLLICGAYEAGYKDGKKGIN